MRTAIVQSRSQLRKLFKRRPERESPSAIGHERYDLISYTETIVAELKLAATTATLRQLDRYLATLGRDRGGRWTGHIVYGNSCSPQLIAEVRARRNVSLWRCDDGPRLEKEG
jgi:RecB family endonuclease NucS